MPSLMKIRGFASIVVLSSLAVALLLAAPAAKLSAAPPDPRLATAYRFEQGLWTFVHLEGDAATVGFQHGYLLAPEIADALKGVRLQDEHDTGRPWSFFRTAAHDMLWPRVEPEYQEELRGIVEGLKAHGVSDIDLDDVVALNAFEELPSYYVPWYNKQHPKESASLPTPHAPGNCSAFV